MPDLTQIVLKAQQMGDAVQRAQADLAERTFTGTAGGNLVSAQVTGEGELTAVTIAPDAVDADDLETLGDLIVAAVRDAQRQLSDQRDSIVASATGGFDLNALGLGGFGLAQPPGASPFDDYSDDDDCSTDEDGSDEDGYDEDEPAADETGDDGHTVVDSGNGR